MAASALALLAAGPAHAGAPSLAFDHSAWGYGTLDVGETASKTFVLTNLGSSTGSSLTVALTDSTSSTAFSITADTCTGITLSQKRSCSVTVRFSMVRGIQTATLTASSKKSAALATVRLAGRGGEPVISVSPGTFDSGRYFFRFFEGLSSQTFTVTNVGDGSADAITTFDADPGDALNLVNDACDEQPLATGASCTFDLAIDTATCSPDGAGTDEIVLIAHPVVRVDFLVVSWGCPLA